MGCCWGGLVLGGISKVNARTDYVMVAEEIQGQLSNRAGLLCNISMGYMAGEEQYVHQEVIS
jgi:hypothetical protein